MVPAGAACPFAVRCTVKVTGGSAGAGLRLLVSESEDAAAGADTTWLLVRLTAE